MNDEDLPQNEMFFYQIFVTERFIFGLIPDKDFVNF